jgi:HD-GYP domain-containing protein (c-di-GMP phosphodiesterase class II)
MEPTVPSVVERLRRLNAIGVALSAEHNYPRLLERIVMGAKDLTNAEGGTLYLLEGQEHDLEARLRFEIMLNDVLGLALGGSRRDGVPPPPLRLYDARGVPDHRMVASHAVLARRTVNIADAYEAPDFDFSGTREFDRSSGYRSRSFLTVPMQDHEGNIIGVLQLINARGARGEPTTFSAADQQLVESLASQAAVAVNNQRLIDAQKRLFEAFIELIAGAIDDKSPYTGGHCKRVPELTMMLAEAAVAATEGPLAGFSMTHEDRDELRIASWLHDCGKITTPEHVVDKATKLQTLFDRIELVDTRLELLARDAEIEQLRALPGADAGERARRLAPWLAELREQREFLRRCNVGGESMSAADQARVAEVAARTWVSMDGEVRPLLTADEVYNLQVPRGTLTPEERQIINDHILATIRMLESLPYPRYLKNVPEYAGGHHERMDGRGYPRHLTREAMSWQARMMGIADIFEALTARDRPYKPGMRLSQALEILGQMKLDRHVDPDLFDLFVRDKVYLRYAREFLDPQQIDPVDESRIPGYTP